MKSYLLLASVLIAFIVGCAHVSVTRYVVTPATGPIELQEYVKLGKGFEVYEPHPYLLVGYTNDPKKAPTVAKIHLPDITKRTRIKQSWGLGNSAMTLNFDGPLLTSFNGVQDSQIDELLTSFGAVASGAGGLLSGFGAALTGGAAMAAPILKVVDTLIGEFVGDGNEDNAEAISDSTMPDWVKEAKAKYKKGPVPFVTNSKLTVWGEVGMAAVSMGRVPRDTRDDDFRKKARDFEEKLGLSLVNIDPLNFATIAEVSYYRSEIEGLKAEIEKAFRTMNQSDKPNFNVAMGHLSNAIDTMKKLLNVLGATGSGARIELYHIEYLNNGKVKLQRVAF